MDVHLYSYMNGKFKECKYYYINIYIFIFIFIYIYNSKSCTTFHEATLNLF